MTSHASVPGRVAMTATSSSRLAVQPTTVRRTAVALGVALSLLLAAVTVRAAAGWAASSAPLSEAPASLSSIEAALAGERTRSAALQAQIDGLRASSDQLTSALGAANDRLTLDQTTADGLRTSLAAAQQKLATLEAALKSAARQGSGGTTIQATGTGGGAEPGDD